MDKKLDFCSIDERIYFLSKLEDGWLNGDGKSPDKKELPWLGIFLKKHFSENIPYVYPMESGNVILEWRYGEYDISLEINLSNKESEFSCLNLKTNSTIEKQLDLNKKDDCIWISIFINNVDGDNNK